MTTQAHDALICTMPRGRTDGYRPEARIAPTAVGLTGGCGAKPDFASICVPDFRAARCMMKGPQNRPWQCPIPARVRRLTAPTVLESVRASSMVPRETLSQRQITVSASTSWSDNGAPW